MKILGWIIFAVIVTVLFGTWPLAVIAKLLEWTAWAVGWVAKLLDFFHWNGILQIGIVGAL